MATKNQFDQQALIVWADVNIRATLSQNGYSFADNTSALICTSKTMAKSAMKELALKFPGCHVYASKPIQMQIGVVTLGKLVEITPNGEVLPE